MTPLTRIGIVGASLAGLRTAEVLRRRGFAGEIIAVGEEETAPYNRPPLSKQYLTTPLPASEVGLPTADVLGVDWRLGTRAIGLDTTNLDVNTDQGPIAGLDAVVIATGCAARRLPVPDLAGIHVLRTTSDADALRESLRRGGPVTVVGAGLIGCEIASSCRVLGIDVTIVDPGQTLMSRALPAAVSNYMLEQHLRAGVQFRLGTAMKSVRGTERVQAVELTDGSTLVTDTLVLAVGSQANTEWISGTVLDTTDGILCDADCQAIGGDGRIFAVGDVCRKPDFTGVTERCEHWSSAAEHAALVARALLGTGDEPRPVHIPFFWSDQHRRRLQVIGRPKDGDESAFEPGSNGGALFTFTRNGHLVGAAAIDRPGRIAAIRRSLAHDATAPVPARGLT